MKKILLILTVSVLAVSFSFGQTTYKGKVSGEKGKDVIGLAMVKAFDSKGNIVEKVQTGGDGKFEITVPAGVTNIEVSKLGYKTVTITVGKKKKLKVKMMKE
ncbi:MAG: carboxypeptidase regulatory-like domain-containing protein [Bacteroidales bacterium]|nr:carboxypeptidase regulatory-like domain-containing protein [Bacteroidales bacterium]